MRKIGIVTTSRADYGLYLPMLKRIMEDPDLSLMLYVSGMHLVPEYGNTIRMIEEDGFPITACIPMMLATDSPLAISKSMGIGTMGFAQVFAEYRPDVMVVLGDRFEMHCAAVAAIPFRIPIAHIHGGELTYGAIDEQFRHSLTKICHLHFASTETYAKRIIQMGEEPWRVIVSGAPGLDNIQAFTLLSKNELKKKYNISFSGPVILVTFHPVTMEIERTEEYITNLINALASYKKYQIVFTYPNIDTSGTIIIDKISAFAQDFPNAVIVENFGQQGYLSMMAYAAAMVGNSSSGIIEAASFKLPVVNVGTRQSGRIKGINVIDTGYDTAAIRKGIVKALSPGFREIIHNMENPYGTGRASELILSAITNIDLELLVSKRFHDLLDY
jgi:UDP-hydrolysing UDP-N-acetyl-D-glucosamine 2-epimerase